MAIKGLNPYLLFNGEANAAIKHYEKALGASVESVQRFGDMSKDSKTPDRIMHALLRIGGSVIMISDCRPDDPIRNDGIPHVLVEFSDAGDMATRFDALAAGGKVTQPLKDEFWGATFGALTDAYGISWMFNCMKPGSGR